MLVLGSVNDELLSFAGTSGTGEVLEEVWLLKNKDNLHTLFGHVLPVAPLL